MDVITNLFEIGVNLCEQKESTLGSNPPVICGIKYFEM